MLVPLLFLTSCAGTPQPIPLTVFAAASLTESFTAMAQAFESEQPGVTVQLNFAGAQTLRLQIEQGARADVFVSANQDHANALHKAQRINQPVIFAYNQLTVIVPAANPAAVTTLADLAAPGLKLVLAGAAVPAGKYARQALENLNSHPHFASDFSQRVLQNLVSEEDTVKGVVAKVQLGEADAGIVYVSDITPAISGEVITLPIPAAYNVVVEYPIALVTDTAQPELAQAFIDFVLSPPGQAIMAEHGFETLDDLDIQR